MIYLETPKKLRGFIEQAHGIAVNVFRPISRKYDSLEHTYPKELDILAAIIDGVNAGGASRASAAQLSRDDEPAAASGKTKNGGNLATVLAMMELCWGDVGLALTVPRQGLGNAAISAVGTEEQKAKYGKQWISMAITEPGAGSDSAAIRSTARLDGDEWVLNGEKIFVTAGDRSDALVVWASLDPSLGRAAIKSFLVPRNAPGLKLQRLDHKLGIRASDTATFLLEDCRIPKENILGSAEIDTSKSFAGAMKTFDNTRPVVAAMACGVARASLERAREILGRAGLLTGDPRTPWVGSHVEAELARLEAEVDVARLLTMKAAWMADNRVPNSTEASMAKAKAGRVVTEVTLRCVELCGTCGYDETELLEKWARDAKILDIFEGTQQIQMLVVARRLLGKTSGELR
ncbi:MAG TPA: acyl-CoA dehydrogenase family protein [Polyangiaceae bacterium]